PATPIALSSATPTIAVAAPASAPAVVRPDSNAGSTTSSVAQPSTCADATVIAAYSALASTDTVKTCGCAFTATHNTPIPSRRTCGLTRLDAGGTATPRSRPRPGTPRGRAQGSWAWISLPSRTPALFPARPARSTI